MITFLQAMAILSVLSAFGVDSTTISKVHDILIPPVVSVATTTPQNQTPFVPIPVVQTPVVPDKPIYFGSTNPSITTTQPSIQFSAPTSTPIVQTPIIPFVVQNAEISYRSQTYFLRIFANIPISIASTTGMNGISIGTPDIDNATNGYTPYWSEAPLSGIPPQVFEYPNLKDADHPNGKGAESRSYIIIIYSKDGQTAEHGVSVPYP